MWLVDAVVRQGHLSEESLAAAVMTGERPAHLDNCDICAERVIEMNQWLDSLREVAVNAADRAFPAERLAAQQSQILRRLEQLDEPARVIAFPRHQRSEPRALGTRRVSPGWLGVAAAAGLVIGLIGGQISARLSPTRPSQQATSSAVAPVVPVSEPQVAPAALPDTDFEDFTPPSLRPFSDITPRLTSTSTVARIGGTY